MTKRLMRNKRKTLAEALDFVDRNNRIGEHNASHSADLPTDRSG
jgi:hypothetical protein